MADISEKDFQKQIDPTAVDYGSDPIAALKGLNYYEYSGPTAVMERAHQLDLHTPTRQNVGQMYDWENSSKYDHTIRYIDEFLNINDYRAQQQSTGSKAVNAVAGGVLSGLLTAVETAGYLVDIYDYISNIGKMDGVSDNEISKTARTLKETLSQSMPIYETEGTGAVGKFFKWNTLKGIIDSAVGFGLPGGAVAKGIGMGMKAYRTTRLAQYLSKVATPIKATKWGAKAAQTMQYGARGNEVLRSLYGGVVMNHGEGMMMAIELREQEEQKYVANKAEEIYANAQANGVNISREEAVNQATQIMYGDKTFNDEVAKQQDNFVNRNRLNIISDAIGLYGVVRGYGATRNILKSKEGIGNNLKTLGRSFLQQGPKEGAEEIGQNILQMEGGYQVRKATGQLTEEDKETPNTWDRVIKYATSEQALLEGMMGLVSGPLQRGATIMTANASRGDIFNKAGREEYNQAYATQQQFLTGLKAKINNIVAAEEAMEASTVLGSEAAYNASQTKLFRELAVEAFRNGTTEKFERHLQDIADLTPEQASERGLKENYAQEAKERIKQLKKMEGIYLDTRHWEDNGSIFSNLIAKEDNINLAAELQNEINTNLALYNRERSALNLDPITLEELDTVTEDQKESPYYQGVKDRIAAREKVTEAIKTNIENHKKFTSKKYQKEFPEFQRALLKKINDAANEATLKDVVEAQDGMFYPHTVAEDGKTLIPNTAPESAFKIVPTSEGFQVMAYDPTTKSYSKRAVNPKTGNPVEADVNQLGNLGYVPLVVDPQTGEETAEPIESIEEPLLDTQAQNEGTTPLEQDSGLNTPQNASQEEMPSEFNEADIVDPEQQRENIAEDPSFTPTAKGDENLSLEDKFKKAPNAVDPYYKPDTEVPPTGEPTDDAYFDIPIDTNPTRHKKDGAPPMRSIIDYFFATRGSYDSPNQSNKPQQRRWFEFIYKNRFGPNTPYRGKLIPIPAAALDRIGGKYAERIDPTSDPNKPKPFPSYWLAITNKEGEFLSKTGKFTKTFSYENSIYTTMSWVGETYEEYLNYYEENEAGHLAASPEEYAYRKRQYRTFLTNAFQNGGMVELVQKSEGIKNTEIGDSKMELSVAMPNLKTSDYEIEVSTTGVITIEGEDIPLHKGSVYFYDKKTGNGYKAIPKTISNEDVETIVKMFYDYINNSIKGNKFESNPIIPNTQISLFAYLQSLVFWTNTNKDTTTGRVINSHAPTAFHFAEKQGNRRAATMIQLGENAIDMVIREKGKMRLNPAFGDALRTFLAGKHYNVKSNRLLYPGESYHHYHLTPEGNIASTRYMNYKEFLYKKILEANMPREDITDENGFVSPRKNQYIRLRPIESAPVVQESVTPMAKPVTPNEVRTFVNQGGIKSIQVEYNGRQYDILLQNRRVRFGIYSPDLQSPNDTLPFLDFTEKTPEVFKDIVRGLHRWLRGNDLTITFDGVSRTFDGSQTFDEFIAQSLAGQQVIVEETKTEAPLQEEEQKVAKVVEAVTEGDLLAELDALNDILGDTTGEAVEDPNKKAAFRMMAEKDSTRRKENIKKTKKWFTKKFPNIPFEIVERLVETGAQGKFDKNMVIVMEGAPEGTTYHEAFHVVMDLFTTEQERIELFTQLKDPVYQERIAELKKRYPNLKEEDLYHEVLADLFEDYKVDYIDPEVAKTNIWQKILNLLKKIFHIGKAYQSYKDNPEFQGAILDMMRRVESNKFTNNEQLVSAGPKVRLKTLKGQNYQISNDAMEGIHFFVMEYLRKNSEDGLAAILQTTNNAVFGEALNNAKAKIHQTAKAFAYQANLEGARIKSGTLDEETLQIARTNLESLITKTKTLAHVIANWNHNATQDGVLDIYKEYVKQFNLELIESTISEESIDQALEEDETTKGRDNSNQYSYDIFISNKASASRLTKLLISSLTKVAEDENGQLRAVPNSLGLNSNVNFGKTFNLLANGLANLQSDASTEEVKNKIEELSKKNPALRQLIFASTDSNGQPIPSWLRLEEANNWSQAIATQYIQFIQSFAKYKNNYEIGIVGGNGSYSSVDANVTGVKAKIISNWSSNVVDKSFKDPKLYTKENDRIKYNHIEFKKRYPNQFGAKQTDKIKSFLEDAGITLVDEAIAEIAQNPNARLNHIWRGITRGSIESLIRTDGLGDNAQDLSYLVDLERKHNPDAFDNSHFKEKGKKVFDNSLFGYLTLVINKLTGLNTKEALYEKLPHLNPDGNLYMGHSLTVDMMMDGRITETKLTIAETNREQDSRNAKEFSDLKYPDRLATVYNKIREGKYNLARPADNSLERFIDIGTNYLSLEDVVNSFNPNNQNRVIDIFVNYLHDELARSQDPNDNYKYYKENKTKGLMINTIARNIPLESLKVQSKESPKLYADRVIEENRDLIHANIMEFLAASVDEVKQTLLRTMIIVKTGDTYQSKGLNLSKVENITEQELNNELNYLVINDIIGLIEQTKLFYGDLAYFKSMTDAFKRFSGAVGTKKVLATGPEVNTHVQKNMKRMDGQEGLYHKHNKKPLIRTAVFNDVLVTSKYLPEIVEALNSSSKAFKAAKERFENDREGLTNWIIKNAKKHKLNTDYINMTEGDGFGVVSLDEYREMKFRAGDWSEKAEMLYQWERQEWEGIPEDQRTYKGQPLKYGAWGDQVFNSLKPQYYGPMGDNGFRPTMYKLSLMPLLPSIVKNLPNLNKLNSEMVKQGVGITVHYSANKGVTTKTTPEGKINDFYNDQGEFIADKEFLKEDKWLTQDTYYEYWGLQLDTGEHSKNKVVTGTQMAKQILNGLFDNGEVNKRYKDSAKVQALVDQYLSYNAERLNLGKEILVDRLGVAIDPDGEYTIEDLHRLADMLTDEAIERNLPDNYLTAIEELKEGRAFIDTLPNREKIENILMSVARSETTSRKRNGKASYQVAATMFENNQVRGAYDDGHLKSSDLAFNISEDGKTREMEVYLPSYLKGVTDVGKVDPRLLNIIGYRIPTQYTSSIEVIKVKGFLPPQAGDIVVVPSEIVAKAGSDFDIDKLNLFIPNSYTDSKGNHIYIEPTNVEAQYAKYKSYRVQNFSNLVLSSLGEEQNQAMKIILNEAVKKHEENFTISAIINELEAVLETKKQVSNSGSIQTDILTLIDTITNLLEDGETEGLFMDEKQFRMKAIENGIQATQTEILTMPETYSQLIAPIKAETLKEDAKRINELRRNPHPFDAESRMELFLSRPYLTQLHDNFIGGKLSIGIAALSNTFHVMCQKYGIKIRDNIKLAHNRNADGLIELGRLYNQAKQYIPDLLNQWVSACVDTVKEPYMVNLNALTNTLNTVLYLTQAGVPSFTVAAFMTQPIIMRYVELQNTYESQIAEENDFAKNSEQIKNIVLKEFGGKEDKNFSKELYSEEDLVHMLTKNSMEFTQEERQMQRDILGQFIQYQATAKLLSEAIQSTTYDTNDAGRNTSELIYKLLLTEKVRNNGDLINYDVLMDSGFISPYYKSVEDLAAILKPMFGFLQDPAFYGESGVLNRIINMYLDEKTKVGKDDIIRVATKFKQDYLVNLIVSTPYTNTDMTLADEAAQLMSGENSLPKAIRDLKENHPSLKENALLGILEPILSDGTTQFDYIKPLYSKLETIETNEVVQAWDELFAYPYNGRNIGEELMKVALLQSGLSVSPMSFTEFAPAREYSKFVKPIMDKALNTQVDYKNLFNSFWIANYRDSVIGIKGKSANSRSILPIRLSYQKKAEFRKATPAQINAAAAKGIKIYEDFPTIKMLGANNSFVVVPGNFSTVNFARNESLVFYGSQKNKELVQAMAERGIDPYNSQLVSTEIVESEETQEAPPPNAPTLFSPEEMERIKEEYKHCK